MSRSDQFSCQCPPFHDPSPQKTRALSPAFSCSSVSVSVSQHIEMEVCNSCSSHTEAKAKVKHHSTHPPKGEEPRLTTVRRAVDTCTLVSPGDLWDPREERLHTGALPPTLLLVASLLALLCSLWPSSFMVHAPVPQLDFSENVILYKTRHFWLWRHLQDMFTI